MSRAHRGAVRFRGRVRDHLRMSEHDNHQEGPARPEFDGVAVAVAVRLTDALGEDSAATLCGQLDAAGALGTTEVRFTDAEVRLYDPAGDLLAWAYYDRFEGVGDLQPATST